MPTTPTDDAQGSSTRPYLIRALHDWCTDNGFTPYLAVYVDKTVQVPREYVKNNEIVLNVSFDATSQLQLGNDFIEFKARFGGVAREIIVPVDHVIAIYARENGQGMAFPVPGPAGQGEGAVSADDQPATAAATPAERKGGIRLASLPEAGGGGGGAGEKKSAAPADGPPVAVSDGPAEDTDPSDPPPSSPGNGGQRPSLRRIK